MGGKVVGKFSYLLLIEQKVPKRVGDYITQLVGICGKIK